MRNRLRLQIWIPPDVAEDAQSFARIGALTSPAYPENRLAQIARALNCRNQQIQGNRGQTSEPLIHRVDDKTGGLQGRRTEAEPPMWVADQTEVNRRRDGIR